MRRNSVQWPWNAYITLSEAQEAHAAWEALLSKLKWVGGAELIARPTRTAPPVISATRCLSPSVIAKLLLSDAA